MRTLHSTLPHESGSALVGGGGGAGSGIISMDLCPGEEKACVCPRLALLM